VLFDFCVLPDNPQSMSCVIACSRQSSAIDTSLLPLRGILYKLTVSKSSIDKVPHMPILIGRFASRDDITCYQSYEHRHDNNTMAQTGTAGKFPRRSLIGVRRNVYVGHTPGCDRNCHSGRLVLRTVSGYFRRPFSSLQTALTSVQFFEFANRFCFKSCTGICMLKNLEKPTANLACFRHTLCSSMGFLVGSVVTVAVRY